MTLDPDSKVDVHITVTATELHGWSPSRTFRFFSGLGQALAAMAEMEITVVPPEAGTDAGPVISDSTENSRNVFTCDKEGRLIPEAPASVAGIAERIEAEPTPNKGGRPPVYTEAQKVEMVEHYAIHGRVKTAEKYGVSRGAVTAWARERPDAVQAARARAKPMLDVPGKPARAPEPAQTEDPDLLAQVEAEAMTPPVPKPRMEQPTKAPVQWPTQPIERRPIDPERTRRQQADEWSP